MDLSYDYSFDHKLRMTPKPAVCIEMKVVDKVHYKKVQQALFVGDAIVIPFGQSL